MKKLIPADTVDAEGTVWETVGENIRRGAKDFSENSVKAIVNILFPVGSVYCGENSFILTVGTWEQIKAPTAGLYRLGVNVLTGNQFDNDIISTGASVKGKVISIRLWKRVS